MVLARVRFLRRVQISLHSIPNTNYLLIYDDKRAMGRPRNGNFCAFLADLEIMDGHPQNEHLARQIIEKLQKMYNLINY